MRVKNKWKKFLFIVSVHKFLTCCDFKTKPGKLETGIWIEILIPDQIQSNPILVRIAETCLVSCSMRTNGAAS